MPLFAITLGPLADAELLFRGFLPLWAAGLLALLTVVMTALLYRREAGRVAGWQRAGLAAVRAGVFLSLVALAMKPTLLREVKGEKPRPVAVLVDDTQSMLTKDPRPVTLDKWRAALAFDVVAPDATPPDGSAELPAGTPESPSRLDVAKAILTNPRLKLLEQLKEKHPLQPARFGAGRAAVDAREEWVSTLAGKEPRTGMLDSVADLLKRDPGDLPSAVVVVTDGRDNSSRVSLADVGAECKRAGVPVHVVVVGGSAAGQIVLREAGVPETLFVDDTAVVPVRFRAKGFKDAQVEIVLKLSGHEVARKVVPVADGDDHREVMSFAPQKSDALPGKQDLTATVKVVTDPAQAADEQVKPVRVVDRKLKVLVAENAPRWDYKFLQRALLRDRRVEATFWLAQGDREALNGGPPFLPAFPANREELTGFDLVVIGDLPASAFSATQLTAVREYVAEGGGLIHVSGGSGASATWVNTPLADVLPVELSADGAGGSGPTRDSFRPAPTPAGARAGALRLADDPAESAKVWAELPGVFAFTQSSRLKPAAETLLQHPSAKTLDGKPAPVLAGHYYGKGYVLFSAIDETWRWRYNAADKYFGRYWSQLVYLAGAPRTLGTKLTQLSLDTPDPVLGSAAQVYARLLKPDLTPQSADSVEAVVERLDGGADGAGRTERVKLMRLPGQPGEYTTALPFNRTGKFSLTVDNGGSPGTVEYRVGLPPDHEQSPGGPAEDDLRSLAEQSGGKFYREEDLKGLPDAVTPQSTPTVTREETVLWNRWALAWVGVLLAVEWTLRRVVSLS